MTSRQELDNIRTEIERLRALRPIPRDRLDDLYAQETRLFLAAIDEVQPAASRRITYGGKAHGNQGSQ